MGLILENITNLDNPIKMLVCLKIMNTFGLVYVYDYDFTLDEKDQAYFLEINPTGDWYWIEHDTTTKLPITDAMINLIESLAGRFSKGGGF